MKDESGMALGLAVVMIVLIGVMGAGLLVFVRNDLEAVIEVNQGQKSFDAAEAGVQAAKAQLRLDADPGKYDGASGTADYTDWSFSGTGRPITLGPNQTATVKIRYLTPSDTPDKTQLPNFAPELLAGSETNYPNNRKYFKIISRGTAGNAQRVIEAIYRTRESGLPTAWYATGNIDWNGNALEVANVSVFAKGNITQFRPDNLTGCDVVYRDWNKPPWNNKSRNAGTRTCTRTDGTTFTGVPTGVGAEGTISYQSSAGSRPGTVDYDNYDGNVSSGTSTRPDFVTNTWTNAGTAQDPTDISYPFNPDPNTQVDLEVLRAIAASGQNGSRLVTKPLGGNHDINDYPSNSSPNTVYFVEFVNADGTYTNASGVANPGSVDYSANATNTNGTIVIVNGDYTMIGNEQYKGIIVLRDPIDNDNVTLQYRNNGNVDVDGYANVEGNITVGGNVDSVAPDDVTNGVGQRAGFYSLERWSWRECYSINCS